MAAWTCARRLGLVLFLGSVVPSLAVPPADDWYPADITPPAGTQYPCALTALPRDLLGIPPAERRFINHTYAMILKATQAKLVLLKALYESKAQNLDGSLAAYLRTTDEALRRLKAEPVPDGLSPFAADVAFAIRLQGAFFRRAVTARQRGTSMQEIFGFPEARTASSHLLGAWSKMARRYDGAWGSDTKDASTITSAPSISSESEEETPRRPRGLRWVIADRLGASLRTVRGAADGIDSVGVDAIPIKKQRPRNHQPLPRRRGSVETPQSICVDISEAINGGASRCGEIASSNTYPERDLKPR